MRKTHHRFQTQPWDLFHPPPQTPAWEELPRPTKRQLTELLVHLLREEHNRKAAHVVDKEADHE